MVAETCGYAHHVDKAQAGKVIPEPFVQSQMNDLLKTMLNRASLKQGSEEAQRYSQITDLYSLVGKVVEAIERG